MPDPKEVISVLRGLADLLRRHHEIDWAEAFDELAAEYEASPDVIRSRIRSLFGGMGSFNDLVLHSPEGRPLVQENRELGHMRSELYETCNETRRAV